MRMLFSKKGDLTLNVIVVAALVLIVLVVLVMIYTGSMGKFVDSLRRAEAGRECAADYNGIPVKGILCPSGTTPIFAAIDWSDNQKGCVCCKEGTTGEPIGEYTSCPR